MNSNRLRLSVVLATHNEETNLTSCLESIRHLADEIVIADEQSQDHTLAVARKFHARVISVPHNDNFHITKNIAIAAAKGDWILQLDADEVVSPELAGEISQIILNTSPLTLSTNGYWINRRNWFLDRFLTKGGQYPDPTLRLYRRGKGHLPARDVHEQAVVQGRTGRLRRDLLHYRDTSLEKYFEGFNRYSSFIAGQLAEQGVRLGLINTALFLFIKPFTVFFKIYIRHRGYTDGLPGFLFALFSGLIPAVAFIKYWQHTQYPA